jgi:hypothetical protein
MIEPASTLWSPLARHWPERQWRRGCGQMAKIGEDVSERLDVIPAQFQQLVTRRPKYACRRYAQAWRRRTPPSMSLHVVPVGLPTEQFIAWIIVSSSGTIFPSTDRLGSSSGKGSIWTAARCATDVKTGAVGSKPPSYL